MAWEKVEFMGTETVLPALICITDELAELVEGKERSEMRKCDRIQENIQSIARLGRASHVHCILATQSASGNLFPSSLKNNIAQRFICGRVEANISRMAIDSEEGESIPLSPGSYLGYSKGDTCQFQGYFTPTKDVLALGTVKPGYDPVTGMQEDGEDSFNLDYEEEIVSSNNSSQEENNSDGDNPPDGFFEDDLSPSFSPEEQMLQDAPSTPMQNFDVNSFIEEQPEPSANVEEAKETPAIPEIKTKQNIKINIKSPDKKQELPKKKATGSVTIC